MPEIGDIYKVQIFFEGASGPYKSRPVLILDYDDNNKNYTIVEITSKAPKDPPGYYDFAKEEIKNWKDYGLDKPSYVKCKNISNVNGLRLYEKIGTMKNTDEFNHIVDRIDECN